MNANRTLTFAAICAVGALGWASPARADVNLLANPGFESGSGGGSLSGWSAFGNAYPEGTNTGVATHAGDGVGKMYGNFWGAGAFNVSGLYQQFPTAPGNTYQFHVYSRQNTGDDLTGGTADNWVVEKLTFFDASNTEIGSAAVEARILDATFPMDTWVDNPTITAIAPAGATSVGAYLLFLQPNLAGGAVFVDDASLVHVVPEPASVGLVGTCIGLLACRRRRTL